MTRKKYLVFLAIGFVPLTPKILIALLVAVVIAANGLFLGLWLGIAVARFRDLEPFINSILAERAVAAWNFCVGFTLLSVMVPLSALVTERFAARAGYAQSLMKSLLVGALALGASLLYQHEHLASLARLAAKFGQPIGALTGRLPENPLAKIVWFTAVCLVFFGPPELGLVVLFGTLIGLMGSLLSVGRHLRHV